MGFAVALIIATIVLVSCSNNNTVLASNEQEVIHVSGKVLCQDCSQGWNEWVHGAKPIKGRITLEASHGCIVSLTCMDKRSRVVHYTSDTTDELGKFEILVNKNVSGKQLDVKLCSLRLVSSPEVACNILTDFGGGKSGIKLNLPSLVYRNLIKYVLDPFYYTTPMCDKPDTSDSNDGDKY